MRIDAVVFTQDLEGLVQWQHVCLWLALTRLDHFEDLIRSAHKNGVSHK